MSFKNSGEEKKKDMQIERDYRGKPYKIPEINITCDILQRC